MTLIADPQPGETVYDPTCGSGGLLLNGALQLKAAGKEYRTLKLYGQEINLITSSIARMNMFLHGIEDFQIVRGNTLSNPAFLENDGLKTFNVILANPPYSIKAWDQKAWSSDAWGRNLWGTPPQGCADYAFQQHIQASMDKKNGRSIVLWPHGVLFRDAEMEMRKRMIESDAVEAVIGLGPNLFYNSPMESCLLLCRSNKPKERRNKILFINAVHLVRTEKAVSFLNEGHIQTVYGAYKNFTDSEGLCAVVSTDDVLKNSGNLSVALYVKKGAITNSENADLIKLVEEWKASSSHLRGSIKTLLTSLR